MWGMMGVTCGSTPRTWVPACAGKTEEVGCGMRRGDGLGVAVFAGDDGVEMHTSVDPRRATARFRPEFAEGE